MQGRGVKKSILMERTTVDAKRTAAEIMTLLGCNGARSITIDHAPDGRIIGMNFALLIEGTPYLFKLPVRTAGVFRILQSRRAGSFEQVRHEERDLELAERVAWRQTLRWIEAQLAMVAAGMAKTEEVFLPYILEPNGRTLFEFLATGGFKLLGPAKEI